jgi:hypothetical protein
MKEILYLGKEVKNSRDTVATMIHSKDRPKLMRGFMRALLKPGPGQAETRGRDGCDDEIL